MSAAVEDGSGGLVGEVLVFVEDGRLVRVEFSSYGAEPLREIPPVGQLRLDP